MVTAHAAEEQRIEGVDKITLYGRIMKAGGVLNPKYLEGVEELKKLLEIKRHKVTKKGKNHIVVDYKKSFVEL